MLTEFGYALRSQLKSPVAAVTAIATIALAIGASAAVFSVAEAVLWSDLPYTNADRLVIVSGEMRQRNATDLPLSGPDFLELRRTAANTFEDFAAVQTGRTLVPQADGTPEQIRFGSVSPNFFRLLGGSIAAGRDFVDADGELLSRAERSSANVPFPARASTVAILSHEYWQRRYGGSPTILGQRLSRDGPQVVGVLAPGFELLFPPQLEMERRPDVWFAARLSDDVALRPMFSHRVIGRLRDGVSLEGARAETDGVSSQLRRVFPLWHTADFHLRLEPLSQYLVAEAKPAILSLLGAAALLLLIACANVANLLLVQASVRERELAVRAALGGSRWRLIRQLLAEALVLGGTGTLIGTALAWAGLRALLAVAPANLPRLEGVAINPVVLTFGAVLGLAAATIFGIAPALRGSKTDVTSVLRTNGRHMGLVGSRRLRSGVVVAETAFAFVVLIGSGLMVRSFAALQNRDPGFVSQNLLTFELAGPRLDEPRAREALARDLHDRLSAIVGVQMVTAASPFPLADRFNPIRWGTEEALVDANKFQAVDYQIVLPGYFETLGTRVIAGRSFNQADSGPLRNTVVIDQLLAAKAFPEESAVGKRLLIRIRTPEPEWVEVIGVVAPQRAGSLVELERERIYFTDGFLGHGAVNRWAVRTTGNPEGYATAVREAVSRIGNQFVVTQVQPMDELVQRAQAGTRFSTLLLGVLAFAAVVLAAVGIYGAISTVVLQRTMEIGIRMALGASPWSIFAGVLRHGMALSILGIVIGAAAAVGLSPAMATMLVETTTTDPVTFGVIASILLLLAAVACSLPGRRAATLDPVVAIRAE